jgi:SAM-dependent methyltransferase
MDSGSAEIARSRENYLHQLAQENRESLLPRLATVLGRIDLAYLDGLHYEGAQMVEIAAIFQHLAPDGEILIDDVNLPEHPNAWIMEAFAKTKLARLSLFHSGDAPLRVMRLEKELSYTSHYKSFATWWWGETLDQFLARFRLAPKGAGSTLSQSAPSTVSAVKVGVPKDLEQNSSSNQPDSIPPEGYSRVLREVGRTVQPAFHPFPRPQTSSKALDRLEVEWWNKNGELIEQVWGLPKEVCEALRRPYVTRASELLKATQRRGPVVELGCGTGWFGRMLVDRGHRVVGIDNSETQIRIATELAAAENKSQSCTYQLSGDLKILSSLGSVQGVVMHCFLHHLYCDELEKLLVELKSNLESGTPVFLVEPVYLSHFAPAAKGTSAHSALAQASAQIGDIRDTLKQQNLLDLRIQSNIEALIAESGRHGVFFSPKEVPFFDW